MINVLSVGAGKEQTPSIEIARKLGYHVIAIDKAEDAPGMSIASIAVAVDIANEQEAIAVARRYGVEAIIPAPIGRYLTTVGAINDALELSGISKQAALCCTDKNAFQKTTEQAGLNRPRQQLVTDKTKLEQALLAFGCPAIIKPRNGSGSRGIVAIHKASDVPEAVAKHFKYNLQDDTLIEEFIDGPEFGIDGAVINGAFQLVLIRGKELTPLPYRQAVGLHSQFELDSQLQQEIVRQMTKCVSAIGLDNCLVHADVILNTNGKAYIIEIAGRPAGQYISNKLVPLSTGIAFLEEGIKLALGQCVDFNAKVQKPFVFRFITAQGSAEERQQLMGTYPELVDLCFSLVDGTKGAGTITCGLDVMSGGYLLTLGDSLDEAFANNDRLLNIIGTRSALA